jgi:hypothetical protein
MQKISLDALAREHRRRARSAPSGRSAETVYGGHEHVLRQALMTLVKGRSLAEHQNPARPPSSCCAGGCGSRLEPTWGRHAKATC